MNQVRNIVLGALVATIVATMVVSPRIGGIEAWKYVLGAVGVWLFVVAGRRR